MVAVPSPALGTTERPACLEGEKLLKVGERVFVREGCEGMWCKGLFLEPRSDRVQGLKKIENNLQTEVSEPNQNELVDEGTI